MRLGRLFKGAAREAIEEQIAKRELEKKLGRKVTEEELYSLGSHLDAAGDSAVSQPLKMTARESDLPFADAKPPMSRKTFWQMILVLFLVVVVPFTVFLVMNLPERTYNSLNPFTPKPPKDSFPTQLGKYTLNNSYDWISGKKPSDNGEHFEGTYDNNFNFIYYKVWNLPDEAEMQSRFEELKQNISIGMFQVADDTASRYAVIYLQSGESAVLFKEGTLLKQLKGSNQTVVNELEGLMLNKSPAAVVMYKMETPTPSASSTVSVLTLLDDYKKDSSAAEKKYQGKTITFSGIVEVSQKDKEGKWMIAFMRPGSTKPTDGMVICSFEKSQENSVSKIKKGDTAILQGKVSMNLLGNIMLDNCMKKSSF